jgi:AraC-like DNA-binding protein
VGGLPAAALTSWKELSLQLGAVLEHERYGGPSPGSNNKLALRASLHSEQGFLLAEELYLRRQNLRLRFTTPRSWLLLVLQGRLAFDPGGCEHDQPLLLSAIGTNLCLSAAALQEFTVVQAPLRLVRLGLPPQRRWSPAEFSARQPLPLLQPMLQLLAQAPDGTRQRLLEALQAYCSTELEAHGISQHASAQADPLALLDDWLLERLDQPLTLADLAAAACLSPRRLQELCQQRYGHSPMERLRQLRLEALHQQLLDPAHQREGLAALYRRWHLSDSAATQQAFKARYGQSPASLRRGAFSWLRR